MTKSDRHSYNALLRKAQKGLGVRRVSATLSADEYAALKASAARNDERVTTHLKRCALAYVESRYLVPPDIEARLDDFVAVMRGIGNNINQLARHSNEVRLFLETSNLYVELKRMEDEVTRFTRNPPRASENEPSA